MVNVKNIVALYDKEILGPEIGDGRLRNRLREGLERTICRAEEELRRDPLTRMIDYDAMYELAESSPGYNRLTVTKLSRSLEASNISTYRDLVNYAGRIRELHEMRPRRIRSLFLRNVGVKCEQLLYTHLAQQGIKLFGDNYKPNELIATKAAA